MFSKYLKKRHQHSGWKRLLCMVFSLFFLVGTLSAQELVNISFDPEADSIYFAKVRKYLNNIRKKEHRPTVALVLAGGGAKGASHIGVLKYLEEKGMPVDFIAGTSMGALMGGMYAMGYSADEIDSIVRSIDWNVMMSDNIPMEFYSFKRKTYRSTYVMDIPFSGTAFLKSLPSGFIYGLNIYNMLSALSVGYQDADMDFIDMPTPFCCVATEVVSQKEKHWTSGPLVEAMRSTMSIPGYFMPVVMDSLIFSDGGTKNNFPTDIAKVVGADIIIGVEMTMPPRHENVNNIADILMQTAQYSGGLEAHNRNRKNATIYITPDISGFGMLSFGTEEIATLISRGYHEAEKHAGEIDSVIRIVGNGGRQLHNKKSINIAQTKVKITSVHYEGVDSKEMQYLDGKIRIKPGNYYGREEFELAQSIIYGTMAFTHVTYHLESDDKDGYELIYRCEKRPTNSIGIGLRADSQDWMSILLNVGFGTNKIYGSEFDVTARLSTSPYLKLEWSYLPLKGPKFGVSLLAKYHTGFGSLDHEYSYKYYEQIYNNEARLFIADTRWSQMELNGGVRVEHLPFYRIFSENIFVEDHDWKKFYPYLYIRFIYDHEDARYFPDRGFRVTANYDYDFRRTHYVSAGIHGVIPVCSFFSILGSLNGRYILGEITNNLLSQNYVGCVFPGHYYEQQIAFFGFNGARPCLELLTTVDLDFRFKVAKKWYVSLLGAAMHDGTTQKMSPHAIYAVGAKVAYKSKFGPLMANVHWNNNTKFGAYISAGYDF